MLFFLKVAVSFPIFYQLKNDFYNRLINKYSSLTVGSTRSLLQPIELYEFRQMLTHQLCWANPLGWAVTATSWEKESKIMTLAKTLACIATELQSNHVDNCIFLKRRKVRLLNMYKFHWICRVKNKTKQNWFAGKNKQKNKQTLINFFLHLKLKY